MFDNAKWAKNQEEIDRCIGQFIFLVFIPNPQMRTVQCWIDEGDITFVEDIDKFLKTLKSALEPKELKKFELACCEYGTPFLYNKIEQKLSQLKEKSSEKRMDFFGLMKEQASSSKTDETFEGLCNDLERISNIKSIIATSFDIA